MISSDPLCLSTPRLTLIPFSADLLELLLTDRTALERRLSAQFLPRWDEADQVDFLTRIRRAVDRDPSSRVWHIYFILHNLDRVVIGNVGLKGPPDRDGSAEVHYGLTPAYRRQGYGLEAVRALVGWAFTRPEVRSVTAVCDHDNVASIRLLEKLGMRRVRVKGRLLWCLWTTILTLDKLGLRRVSAFLRRQLSRGISVLRRLGAPLNVSLVWHLPKSGWVHHAEEDQRSACSARHGRLVP